LRKLLEAAKGLQGEPSTDSPVFQLVDGYSAPDIARLDFGHFGLLKQGR
jgi:hypothetical protein